MKAWIGIDPGKSGAVAILYEKKEPRLSKFPLAGNEMDARATYELLRYYYDSVGDKGSVIAIIEKVGAMPGQGVSSTFHFGFNTGLIHGILASIGVPVYLVTPQAWKKTVLTGLDWKYNKVCSVEYCVRAYPNTSLLPTERSKKPHTGLADALCIASYAKQVYG